MNSRGASLLDRARDTQTDEIVALKKVRMDKEKDGELREVESRAPGNRPKVWWQRSLYEG